MASRPRMEPDGSLIYPNRGPLPVIPIGMERDPGNPYRLIVKLPDCELRFNGQNRLPCGRVILFYKCVAGFNVSAKSCQQCISSGQQATAVAAVSQAPANQPSPASDVQ